MQTTPTIHPLKAEENIYALVDERGNTIGAGTREVCEVLLYIVTRSEASANRKNPMPVTRHTNVRAAITI
jgi:hypothetical protein